MPPFSLLKFRFTEAALFCLVVCKILIDALYEFPVIRYFYITGLLISSLILWQLFDKKKEFNNLVAIAISMAVYFFLKTKFELIYFGEFFKLISPVVLLVLWFPISGSLLLVSILCASWVNIGLNLASVIFDGSWIMWGDYLTFRGIYYFKTDLAFSLVMSLIVIGMVERFSLNLKSLIALIAVGGMVYLSNSRANYVLYLIVVMGFAYKSRASVIPVSVIFSTSVFSGWYAWDAIDSGAMLGFDFDNFDALTQGRNVFWDIIINEGFNSFSLVDWIFGLGYLSDVDLYKVRVYYGDVIDAHNDVMHLLFNFGVLGLFLFYFPFLYFLKISWGRFGQSERIGVVVALLCYFVQGLSAVMSSFALKTWALVFVLFCATSVLSDFRNRLKGGYV